jgi:hypothetical protein
MDLRQIRFSKQVAESQDQYSYSIEKGNEYRRSVEIQRSVKAGIREFFKVKDQVINLVLNMILWFLTIMNYQINDYYENYFPGDQFQDLAAISAVELFGYVAAGLYFDTLTSKPCTKLYVISYSICLLSAIGIIFNDEKEN